jgi:hypothetical protein
VLFTTIAVIATVRVIKSTKNFDMNKNQLRPCNSMGSIELKINRVES